MHKEMYFWINETKLIIEAIEYKCKSYKTACTFPIIIQIKWKARATFSKRVGVRFVAWGLVGTHSHTATDTSLIVQRDFRTCLPAQRGCTHAAAHECIPTAMHILILLYAYVNSASTAPSGLRNPSAIANVHRRHHHRCSYIHSYSSRLAALSQWPRVSGASKRMCMHLPCSRLTLCVVQEHPLMWPHSFRWRCACQKAFSVTAIRTHGFWLSVCVCVCST